MEWDEFYNHGIFIDGEYIIKNRHIFQQFFTANSNNFVPNIQQLCQLFTEYKYMTVSISIERKPLITRMIMNAIRNMLLFVHNKRMIEIRFYSSNNQILYNRQLMQYSSEIHQLFSSVDWNIQLRKHCIIFSKLNIRPRYSIIKPEVRKCKSISPSDHKKDSNKKHTKDHSLQLVHYGMKLPPTFKHLRPFSPKVIPFSNHSSNNSPTKPAVKDNHRYIRHRRHHRHLSSITILPPLDSSFSYESNGSSIITVNNSPECKINIGHKNSDSSANNNYNYINISTNINIVDSNSGGENNSSIRQIFNNINSMAVLCSPKFELSVTGSFHSTSFERRFYDASSMSGSDSQSDEWMTATMSDDDYIGLSQSKTHTLNEDDECEMHAVLSERCLANRKEADIDVYNYNSNSANNNRYNVKSMKEVYNSMCVSMRYLNEFDLDANQKRNFRDSQKTHNTLLGINTISSPFLKKKNKLKKAQHFIAVDLFSEVILQAWEKHYCTQIDSRYYS